MESLTKAVNLAQSLGGKARAESLTPDERSDIAQKAARARWGSKDKISWRNGDIFVEVPTDMDIALWEKLNAYINLIRPS